jgi:dihydrofolate reductase
MSIQMIAAVNGQGVLGDGEKLLWNHPPDMKFFRRMTADSTVVMGRKTFQSIGRALPKRRNVVISSEMKPVDTVEVFSSLEKALHAVHYEHVEKQCFCLPDDVWLIGGASIYREGLKHADKIYLTLVPDQVEGKSLVYFPWIDPTQFQLDTHSPEPFDEDPTLKLLIYTRIK